MWTVFWTFLTPSPPQRGPFFKIFNPPSPLAVHMVYGCHLFSVIIQPPTFVIALFFSIFSPLCYLELYFWEKDPNYISITTTVIHTENMSAMPPLSYYDLMH